MIKSPEPLVVTNLDPKLRQFVEDLEIDSDDLDQYARGVGVEEAIFRHAEATGGSPKPAIVNIHAEMRLHSSEEGAYGLIEASYNLSERSYGQMLPADIDIFVGSLIALARDKDTTAERDLFLNQSINYALTEELIHFGDPNLLSIKLNRDTQEATYPGAEQITKDPKFREKNKAYNKLSSTLSNRLALSLFWNIVASATAASVVYEASPVQREVLAITTLVTSFVGGLAITGKFNRAALQRWAGVATELASVKRELDPAEIYAKNKAETIPSPKIIDIKVDSYALRNIPILKGSKWNL